MIAVAVIVLIAVFSYAIFEKLMDWVDELSEREENADAEK